jgi:hypothetical protein
MRVQLEALAAAFLVGVINTLTDYISVELKLQSKPDLPLCADRADGLLRRGVRRRESTTADG